MVAVMLLCAGYGTRLSPLTDECPKALVPVGDRPIIGHQLERLRAKLHQATIVANTHHFAEQISAFLDGYDPRVKVIIEPMLLGTAGGLRGALKHLGNGPILVANVDVISTINYLELLHNTSELSLTLAIAPMPLGKGTVGVDAQGKVVRLRGETFGKEVAGGDYLGTFAIGPELARRVPERGCLVSDFFLPLLRFDVPIGSSAQRGAWVDIGTIASYASCNFDWLRRRGLDYWLEPGSTISDGIELRETIVGRGSRIEGRGLLERVILWPYTHVQAPLSNVIVTASGTVVPISTTGPLSTLSGGGA